MTVFVSDSVVDSVIGAMMGAARAGGGPTKEQRTILVTLVEVCWGRDQQSIDDLNLSPTEAAHQVVDEGDRRRLKELLVMHELCGHPVTKEREAATEEYLEALDQTGRSLTIARDLVQASAKRTFDDFLRLYASEWDPPIPSGEIARGKSLGEILGSYSELPEGTLGRAFFDFHQRNGFALPNDTSSISATFMHHDTAHVIAGYEPTGEGEIALGGMLLAAADTEKNWFGFIGNLLIHEVGYMPGYEDARRALLDHGLGRSMLAEALQRGTKCGRDFSEVDLLDMAPLDLTDVRAEFCVPPLGVA